MRGRRREERKTHGEVLEEPGAHDVGGDFGEDAALLLALLAAVVVVVLARAVARADAGVT